ncbi:GrpB family protein [Reinekea sp.]|uniref:GrpB family protein n=1 Tax=Reinekea sp. TaxID=1970455 RepID=UPI003988CA36
MIQRIIEVVDYQTEWVTSYERERQRIESLLDTNNITAIHHIGSTSVVGLCAKPIIDMLIEVQDLSVLDSESHQMAALGYLVKGEFGIPGRRYFQKGGIQRSHQVHAFTKGTESAIRHLAFRDYLRAFPEIAAEYGRIKQEAASLCNNDITAYGNHKNSFIKEHEAKAVLWKNSQLTIN